MKTVESYLSFPDLLRQDPATMARRYKAMIYDLPLSVLHHVKQMLLPGSTVCLFSGSWRLYLDATYLELRQFQNCNINYHPNTLFVNHEEPQLFDYVLTKLSPTNLLVLHNDWWTAHNPVEQLIEELDILLKHVQPSQGQVICTLPLIHVNWNKLKMSVDDMANLVDAVVADDSMIFVRRCGAG